MFRESLTPGSPFVFMSFSATNSYLWETRASSWGLASATATPAAGSPPDCWIMVMRNQNTFCGFIQKGGNWVMQALASIPLATNIYIGLVAASGTTNDLVHADFTNLSVTP
jgi:regulation of enolase protein 1 (concanavalin A-like superfamily)